MIMCEKSWWENKRELQVYGKRMQFIFRSEINEIKTKGEELKTKKHA